MLPTKHVAIRYKYISSVKNCLKGTDNLIVLLILPYLPTIDLKGCHRPSRVTYQIDGLNEIHV